MTNKSLFRLLAAGVMVWFTAVSFAQQPASQIRFDVTRYQVEGDTLLGQDAIDKLLAPYTGKNLALEDVQKARAALQKTYADKGLTAVQVILPKQELEKGVIRLTVIQAALGKVSIQGNKFFSEANVRNSLPALVEGRPLDTARFAANVQLANENPSRQMTVVLRPGAKEGVMDADVKVADERPWKAFVSLDNTGNERTGSYRLGVGFQHSNLFDRDHVLTAQYTTSPDNSDDVSIFGLGYRIPLYRLGHMLDLFAGYSDVDSGTIQEVFNVSGKGTVLGARYNQIFLKRGNYSHKLVYGLDYRAYEQNVTFVGVQLGSDITLHPFSLSYVGSWRKPGEAEAEFFVSALANIAGGDDGDDAAFERARPGVGVNADYTLLRLGASYTRVLRQGWSLRAALNGQITGDPLVSPEQFGLGGADSVRGFRERQVVNDEGYRGTLELYTPDFGDRFNVPDLRSRMVFFYDFGHVKRHNPLPLDVAEDNLESYGAGFRIAYGKRASLKLDFARVVNGDTRRNEQKDDSRVHFSLAVLF